MDTPVANSTKPRSVKINEGTWSAVSHESVDRRATISDVIGAACHAFLLLPEQKREDLVRGFEADSAATTAA